VCHKSLRVQSVALAESPHVKRILGVKTAENYATGFRAYVRSSGVFAGLRFGGAAYFVWARLPAAYPAAMKLTGVAGLTRFAVDRLATIYLAIGVMR